METRAADGLDYRVLVLAPTGRDAALARTALAGAGVAAEICRDVAELAARTEEGAGAGLIAEEALLPLEVQPLLGALRRQPPWSDLPMVVVTVEGTGPSGSLEALRTFEPLGHVTLLERPLRVTTLVSAVQAALRARRRQYEVRDHLRERERAAAERAELLSREQAARREAEVANRAKDDFLATLSHELRTPLQAVLGWVEVLRRARSRESWVRGLDVIDRNARAQAQLIEDLLDVSRIVTGRLRLEQRSVELLPVLEAAFDSIRPSAQTKDIRLTAALEPVGRPVLGDPGRLQQVVWNLLSNAVKFTPPGGSVELLLQRAGDVARIVVRDSGDGIRPELLADVFDRFRQADSTSTRAHGGLGLGLAIARHLVQVHGGAIQAESAGPGQGATFTVSLPLGPEAALPTVRPADAVPARAPAEVLARTPDDAPLRGLSVLLVEDELDARELLVAALEQYGARVSAGGSVREALEILDQDVPDVVVSDISMPEQDGYDFIRQLRARETGGEHPIPALALTAYARAEDRERALAAGFELHLAKPVEPRDLAAAVARLAARRRR